MIEILYLCDHKYECANSLFCKLNGGDCDHTVQSSHSRTGIRPQYDIVLDERFEQVRESEYVMAYIEKETKDEA